MGLFTSSSQKYEVFFIHIMIIDTSYDYRSLFFFKKKYVDTLRYNDHFYTH